MVKNLPLRQETWVWSWDRGDPLEKEMAAHSSILTWKSHGQGGPKMVEKEDGETTFPPTNSSKEHLYAE